MIVDQVKEGLYLGLFFTTVLQDRVSILLNNGLVSQLKELDIHFQLLFNSLDEPGIHEIGIFKHFES